jgi:hypothetical protein
MVRKNKKFVRVKGDWGRELALKVVGKWKRYALNKIEIHQILIE